MAEVQAGGGMDASERVVGRAAVAEVSEHRFGPLAGRDEPDVGGRRRERLLQGVLVVVALRRDDDERALVDVASRRSSVVITRAAPGWSSGSPPSSTATLRQPRPAAIAARAPAAGERPIATSCGCGRTAPRRPPIAPSLWHAIGTVTTPSRPWPVELLRRTEEQQPRRALLERASTPLGRRSARHTRRPASRARDRSA